MNYKIKNRYKINNKNNEKNINYKIIRIDI